MIMRHILVELGLTESEASAYEALIKLGKQPASELLRESGLSRPNLYYALGQLQKRGLVKENRRGKAVFEAVSPRELEQLGRSNVERAQETLDEFRQVLPGLLSQYTLSTDKPVVWFREGIQGLADAYEDIHQNAKDLLIIPSRWDRTSPELNKLIDQQVKRQHEKGIKVRVIADGAHTTPQDVTNWKKYGMLVRLVPQLPFSLPAQILIWNNTVALTTFRKELLTTMIQHEDVAESMRLIFDVLWHKTEIAGG